MGRIYYSAARGGFFNTDSHNELPDDAVRISALRHAELLAAQATGRKIVPGDKGKPVLAPAKAPGVERLRAWATEDLSAEATRRIEAVASRARQSNDNALIAQAALAAATGAAAPDGLDEAMARRATIDAIRAAFHRAAAIVARMPAANLTDFDATAARYWVEG